MSLLSIYLFYVVGTVGLSCTLGSDWDEIAQWAFFAVFFPVIVPCLLVIFVLETSFERVKTDR